MSVGGTAWSTATSIPSLPYTSDAVAAADYIEGDGEVFPYYSAFWSWTPAQDVSVKIHSFASTGDYPDTKLYIFTGSEGAPVEVAHNDDAGDDGFSQVKFDAEAGITYHIVLGSYSSTADDTEYVLTAVMLAPLAGNLTKVIPPASATIENTSPFGGPLTEFDINPSGLIAARMTGYNDPGVVANGVEYHGVWIGRRGEDNSLETIYKTEFFDSTEFATTRTSTPESVLGYYWMKNVVWVNDDTALVIIDVSQYPGFGGTIPSTLNFRLLQVVGDTVVEGDWFEIPDVEFAFGYPASLMNLNDGQVVFLARNTTNIGSYVNDFSVVTFEAVGVDPGTILVNSLGEYSQIFPIGRWEDSFAAWTDNVIDEVPGNIAINVYDYSGDLQFSYTMVEFPWLESFYVTAHGPSTAITGSAEGDRGVWFFSTTDGAEQRLTAAWLNVETGELGDFDPYGEPMVDATTGSTECSPYLDGVYQSDPTHCTVVWESDEDPDDSGWTKQRAVSFAMNADSLTIEHEVYVIEAVEPWYDPINPYYMGYEGAIFGRDYGLLKIDLDDDGTTYSYFLVDFTFPTGSTIFWWNGTALQPAELLGWWDGNSVEPSQITGWWDNNSIEPVEGS